MDARLSARLFTRDVGRLEKIKETMPFMLDVNLRDLREAMNF